MKKYNKPIIHINNNCFTSVLMSSRPLSDKDGCSCGCDGKTPTCGGWCNGCHPWNAEDRDFWGDSGFPPHYCN